MGAIPGTECGKQDRESQLLEMSERLITVRLEKLGDALDHWKGSLVRLLQGKNALVNLHVLPMITDPIKCWTPPHFCLYAHLLGVDVSAILNQNVKICQKQGRSDYFMADPSHDLFLDPDTGIREKESQQHVKPSELMKYLVPKGSSRLLLIYQHKDTRKNPNGNKQSVEEILKDLAKRMEGKSVFVVLCRLCQHDLYLS